MRNASIWLAATAALFAACSSDKDNNVTPDSGTPDMVATDMSTNNNTDVADLGRPDEGAPDMAPPGVSVPGLSAPVTVRFDDQGVLHVACATAADCYAVQGYYHAAHRFGQMDILRRFTTGRLSALLGGFQGAIIEVDRAMRTLISTRDGQPLEQAMWEETGPAAQQAITAYTRGVNAWLADLSAGRNGADLPDEYKQPLVDQEAAVTPWTETDSIAVGLNLLDDLSNRSGAELQRGIDYPKLTATQAFDLLGTMSATQVSTMGASGETYDYVQALLRWPDADELNPALDRLRGRERLLTDAQRTLAALSLLSNPEPKGSNNWVIGGSLTTSGEPILANDPHLGLSNPSLWYLVQIHASGGTDDVHTAGVSLPGVPGVVLGHNENIAWGATVVNMDLSDVYVEELTPDGSGVNFNGGTVPIVEVEHTFEVAREEAVTQTLRFVPHHGPVLSYDPDGGEAISLRWAANDARKTFDIFFGLATATTIEEARVAITNSASTNQNWVVADRNGDIAWFPFNALPERTWASLSLPPWLPLPGDGTAEWGPIIPPDDQPQMRNPTSGFIATANTDPTGATFDGDPTNEPFGYITVYGEFGGFRQDAIVKRIVDAGAAHTAEISRDMQGDNFLVLRDWVLPHLQTTVDDNPGVLSAQAQTLWSALETWDGDCPSGIDGRDPTGPKTADATIAASSIGCAAFHFTLYELTDAAFADELAPTDVSTRSAEAVRSIVVLLNDPGRLQGGDVYWDDVTTVDATETRDEVILAALENAATVISAALGADPDDWRWGRAHTLTLSAPAFSLLSLTAYNEGPYAAPGGLLAINVANPNGSGIGGMGFSNGPSMRHVAEFTADGIRSYWTLPGGQRHFRDSPHYDDLLDDWFSATHFAMPFQPADVEAAAQETIEVVPR